MIYAKAVTQNPRRKATPKDVEAGVLNTDGEPCKTKDDVYVFTKGFLRAVPQITDAKELEALFKLTAGTELPYPEPSATTKTKLTVAPVKEQLVDIINKGLVAVYSAALLKAANEKKVEAVGRKKKGRGPADLDSSEML